MPDYKVKSIISTVELLWSYGQRCLLSEMMNIKPVID
jgi:hypothetical protein